MKQVMKITNESTVSNLVARKPVAYIGEGATGHGSPLLLLIASLFLEG